MKTLTSTTLTQRVAAHYTSCLEVNSSWREFTNGLGVLNLFDVLDECNYEFVAELMMGDEDFENEDFNEMVEAIGEFLADRTVPAEFVDCSDLVDAQNATGFDFKDVARLAIDAGVPDEEIALYLEEALSNEELNG